ncbi:hypothetical protein RU95_GL003886 [Enterococcus avium]|nr:hypothetical protein RU95_GL003886 [Enterococcus avium]
MKIIYLISTLNDSFEKLHTIFSYFKNPFILLYQNVSMPSIPPHI